MAQGPKNVRFAGWPLGINNVFPETNIAGAALRQAKNVDLIGPEGKIRRREGYAKLYAGVGVHSVTGFSSFLVFAEGGNLKLMIPSASPITVATDLNPSLPVWYEKVNGVLYWSNGEQSGQILPDGTARRWGVECPYSYPTASALAIGGLSPGTYQIAVVFVRDQEESGAPAFVSVELEDGGSIQLDDIPQPSDADIDSVRLYRTEAYGETLYYHTDLPVGLTSVSMGKLALGKALETEFMNEPPPGHLIAYYNGRVFIAWKNVLYYTEAMRYGLIRQHERFFQFAEEIDLVAPTEGGIYVAAGDETYFLQGDNPENFAQRSVYPHGAVRYTQTQAPASMFNRLDLPVNDEDVAVWWSKNGVMILGLANGRIVPVREGELSLPEFEAGAVMPVERNGVRQLLSVMRNPGTDSRLTTKDSVSIQVTKNGITL